MSEGDFLTPELMKGTNWRALERAVARTMSHCGWTDVKVIGRRGDGGGDILAKRLVQGREKVYVVQVKSVTGTNYVGPDAIQEVIDALSLYNADACIVATNGEFTGPATIRASQLKEHGIECRLWNGTFLKLLLSQWPEEHHEKRKPRKYQEKIITKTYNKFKNGGRTAQLVVATGLGKSTIAGELSALLREQGLNRIMVLCHSQPLCLQLEQSFWPQIGKGVPTHVFFNGVPPKRFAGINFGTYQTLIGYLSGLNEDDFDLIIVDEAHHALADGFLLCLNHLRPKLLIGMTATPWRGDGRNINDIFGDPVEEISLVDGMKMGYLAKVSYRIFCDTVDWRDVFQRDNVKDMSIKDLNKKLFLPQRDEAMISETMKVAFQIPNPRIIFFCASVEHCKRLSDLINLTGIIRCKPLSGVNPLERYKSLMEFSTGKIQAVTAVDVLNEGIDVPDVNIIVFLRVTHSRRIFVQQLGRGLRISPSKKEVIALDFVSDIRRLMDVLVMNNEAKKIRGLPFETIYFPNGFVRFENEGILPFVEQWLNDITKLSSDDEKKSLSFPEV